jgi:ferredoxin
MIVTEQKPFAQILDSLQGYTRLFLVGCGECSTTCKTGGKDEVIKMQQELEAAGKTITGVCIPGAPCISAQIKVELAKNTPALRQAEAILVLACGLGVQSVKDNDRTGKAVFPGCDTVFGAVMDAKGDFYEKCSMCGECLLGVTAGICPVTLCPKGLLNGPCGGMNKGKCEVDSQRDCAWVLIYKESARYAGAKAMKAIQPPKDFHKTLRPRKKVLTVT